MTSSSNDAADTGDQLAAAGKTQEEIAAELEVSAAALYNWRRQYGGMDTDAAKALKKLQGAEQPAQTSTRTDAELKKDVFVGGAWPHAFTVNTSKP